MPERYAATFPGTAGGVARIRREVAQFAAACGLSEERLPDVKLAISEAASNVVVHAYRDGAHGDIRVSADVSDGELVVVVADDGLGMMPRPDSPGLGLGIPVITTVSDRMEIVSEGAGTELHIAFRM